MIASPFAPFALEPSPSLDLEALKTQFHRATAEGHPDKFQTVPEAEKIAAETRYAEINRAYQTLIDPRQRLLALYELTAGKKPGDIQRIPPGTMDLFVEVGQVCQNLDGFLARKKEATGALARAGLMAEELDLQDKMMTLRGKLEQLSIALESELVQLDALWRAAAPEAKPLPALETLYRKYSYLARWRQQLEEREIALLTGE